MAWSSHLTRVPCVEGAVIMEGRIQPPPPPPPLPPVLEASRACCMCMKEKAGNDRFGTSLIPSVSLPVNLRGITILIPPCPPASWPLARSLPYFSVSDPGQKHKCPPLPLPLPALPSLAQTPQSPQD